MAFKHPEILFFLFAIAIPIIIHLFSFRRYKQVYFHNIQFIKNIQIEQNSTKSKLKERLILLSRIGLITCAVLTFAQPYIPSDSAQLTKKYEYVAIYIDNSFSTQAETDHGIVLEFEKKKAAEIIDAHSPSTKFFLLTNTVQPTEQYALTSEEIKNKLSKISLSPNRVQFSDIQKRLHNCEAKYNTSLACHVLSDMQKNTFDKTALQDTTLHTTFYPIENQTIKNIVIDSCYFESNTHVPNQAEKFTVVLRNNSDETQTNIPVKLYLNDSLKAISSATIKPFSTTNISIEYNTKETGFLSGHVEIEDYPILYDNTYYFSYFIDDQIRIIDIFDNRPNPHIAALCKNQPNFILTTQQSSSIHYSSLGNNSVIVLDALHSIPTGLSEEIKKLRSVGKTIVCIPSDDIDLNSYNSFLSLFGNQRFTGKDTSKTSIERVDEKNAIFKNMFEKKNEHISYPYVNSHYILEPQSNNSLVTLQNQHAFAIQRSSGFNTLFLFTAPLTESQGTVVASPLFVGLYTIFQHTSSSSEIQTTIGNTSEIFTADITSDDALHIENPKKNIDVIPLYRNDIQTSKTIINPMQQITEAGNYFVTQKSNPIANISYNYDRKESELEWYTLEELKTILQDKNLTVVEPTNELTSALKESNEGKPLWRVTLWAAICFVVFEVLLILFYDKLTVQTKNK